MATAAKELQSARKSDRKRVLMRGTVFTPEGAFVVWLRDISSTGALIAGETRLPTDCDVIFKRGPIFAAAKVAWSNDTGAGLEFYRNLDKYEIASAELPLPNRED